METEDNPDNKQICRLCLDIVPDADAEAIEEKKKTILEVLLINIDLHVTENAVACSRCTEKLQTSFEFKSACLHVDNCISTFVDADIPVDIKKVFHGEVRGTAMANVNLENTQICRLCMSLITDKALDCNLDLKDIIANCLPEVDIHTVHEPLVCELCVSQMKRLHELMNACQEVERRINNYCQVASDRAIPISLNDLLKFKNSTISGIIKEECSNSDNNVLKDVKKEDTASIECEEIHIKTELGSGDEMEESLPSGAYNNSGKRRRQKRECTSKEEKLHVCPKCPFSTKRNRDVKRHMLTHSHETKEDSKHLDRQSSHERKFNCHHCGYESHRKDNLNRHILAIHERENATVHSCQHCSYKTVYAGSLCMHLRHHGERVGKGTTCKCPCCEKEFNGKQSLDNHLLKTHESLQHLITSRVRCCTLCSYKSIFTTDLKGHIARKHDPKNAEKFYCHNCDYFSLSKSHLKDHVRVHSNFKPYVCTSCKRGFNKKCVLDSHILSHHKGDADLLKTITREIHQCTLCKFESVYKSHLSKHIKVCHV